MIGSLYGLGSLTWAVHVKYWWFFVCKYSVLLGLEEWFLVVKKYVKKLGNRVENIMQYEYNSCSMSI